jgi:hypothetical protein
LAEILEAVAPTGEEFVDVGLVAGVPKNDVLGRLEDAMESDGEFDDAEIGAEMPARLDDARDDELADLLTEFVELLIGEWLKIVGCLDGRQDHEDQPTTGSRTRRSHKIPESAQ